MSNWRILAGMVVALSLLVSCPVSYGDFGEEDPTVIEDFDGLWSLEYIIINPEGSTVDDIVGFVIEVDPADFTYFDYFWTDTANGWEHQAIDDPGNEWDAVMASDGYPYWTYPLTWKQFFGGMDYPFDEGVPAAAYWVPYSQTSPGVYEFDDGSLSIAKGELLDQFFAATSGPLSTYYLAYIGDAESDTFDDNGLNSIEGEAIPEPATVGLLVVGSLAALAKRGKR